jgi:hypothetical protein
LHVGVLSQLAWFCAALVAGILSAVDSFPNRVFARQIGDLRPPSATGYFTAVIMA